MKNLIPLMVLLILCIGCSPEEQPEQVRYVFFDPGNPTEQIFSWEDDITKGGVIRNRPEGENYITMDFNDTSFRVKLKTVYDVDYVKMSGYNEPLHSKENSSREYQLRGDIKLITPPSDGYYMFTIIN